MRSLYACLSMLALLACHSGDGGMAHGGNATTPGDTQDARPFAEIAPDETVHFTGTEPFWGGRVSGATLLWTTPENIEGETIAVTRFAGRGGLSFSGQLAGASFDLAITPGACSDGMSDRVYRYVVTVSHGTQVLNGCAWLASDPAMPPA